MSEKKKKIDWVLTSENLAFLGILSETQALYTRISMIWDCISSSLGTTFQDGNFSTMLTDLSGIKELPGRDVESENALLNPLSGVWFKKVLTEYLYKHLDVYALHGQHHLVPKNVDLRYNKFRVLAKVRYKRPRPLEELATSELCNPQEFLQELEDLIVRINCSLSHRITGITISPDTVRNTLRDIVTSKIESMKTTAGEKLPILPKIIKSEEMDWLFTTKRLLALGLYDAFYSLYKKLCAIAQLYKESLTLTGGIEDWFAYGGTQESRLYKNNINFFLYQHSAFFFEHPLYISDVIRNVAFLGITMFAHNRKEMYFYPEGRIITFAAFQKKFHHLLLTMLVRTRIRHGENIHRDDAYWGLKERLDRIVSDVDYKSNLLNVENIQYDLSIDSKTIWVYVNFHNLKCNQCEPKHSIIPKIVSVKPLVGEHRCNLPVNYCEDCEEYFIGKHSLAIVQKEHGPLLARLHSCSPKQCSEITWSEFNSESELHSCGYRVGESGLSFVDRRDLLKKLLDAGAMDKFSIRRDISKAISIFENNPLQINAVKDWYEDMEFIDGYGNDEYVGKAHLGIKAEGDNNR